MYFRLTAVLFAACLMAPSAAFAAYYSNTKCDGPHFEPYILAHLGNGISFRTNQQVSDHVRYGPITQSTLVSNTGDSLTCEVTVTYGFRQIRGRFSSTKTTKGFTTKWLPAY